MDVYMASKIFHYLNAQRVAARCAILKSKRPEALSQGRTATIPSALHYKLRTAGLRKVTKSEASNPVNPNLLDSDQRAIAVGDSRGQNKTRSTRNEMEMRRLLSFETSAVYRAGLKSLHRTISEVSN
jgi:hypothetical protein